VANRFLFIVKKFCHRSFIFCGVIKKNSAVGPPIALFFVLKWAMVWQVSKIKKLTSYFSLHCYNFY